MTAAGGLASLLQQLRCAEPSVVEPDVDDRELGLEDAAKFREEEDLKGGAVLKGIVEAGEGDATPQAGDLVFLHYSLLDEHREVVCSTHLEHGGNGSPQPFVLGRGQRMLRGMELSVLEMRRGESVLLDIKPEYAFLHKDSGLALPQGLRREAPVVADVTLTDWHGPSSGIKCLGKANDVFLRTLRPGQGWESPRPPFEVSLHLDARSLSTARQHGDGASYFCSTSDKPLACSLGTGQLPPGIETAVQAMQRQQEAVVYCPLNQLRGGTLVPDPPSAADVVGAVAACAYAEVKLQLLDFSQVRDMTGDGAVMKRIVRKGDGEFPIDCPLEDSRVRVHYRLKTHGTGQWLVDSRGADGENNPLEFETGMGEVPEALDMCVRLMLRNEVASVISSWRYAFEGRPDVPHGLASGSSVEFELELVGFDQAPSQHVMSGPDKVQRALHMKEQGNALFLQGKTKLARQKYQKALKLLGGALSLDAEELAAASTAKAACLLNLARCAEQEQEWGEALTWCNKAIGEDDQYTKAYFRRALVAACLGEYEAARDDFATCAQLDESTAADCERELRRMERVQQAAQAKQRDALKGFFNR